jgi:predicted molibdopterin-dependent oxidoreductase YjgC
MGHQLTTCTFCGVGCGIYLETAGDKVIGVYPSKSHPANQGRICVRGWNVHEVASSPDRLKKPLIRKNGDFREVSWDEAYGFIAERLGAIRKEHGPNSIGFLASPRCSNEESYLLQKFARAVIGTNNLDHGTSVHRINTISAFQDQIGMPAATSSIRDLEKSEVIIMDGIDLARQLPTIGGWVLRAKLAGAKLIATGPRKHRLVGSADMFLQYKPRSAVCLYGAMAKVIVNRGLMDLKFIKAHCKGYEKYLERIQEYDVLWAAERCGVAPELIAEAAVTYAKAKTATIIYSSGVEARGTEPIQAIIDLALLTGNLGKEGSGIMPLTEHNNLQGCCDMGILPDLLPGYRPVADAEARASLEGLWGSKVPVVPGFGAVSMLGDRGKGKLRALWLNRHNPVVTATLGDATEALDALDFVVLQHLFLTETARYADVVLPTVAYGEERVTFTSTERRIQIAEKVSEPPQALASAWEEIVEVANRMGAGWKYDSSADVMEEIGKAVPFYEGATYENLARDYGRQWPCTRDLPLGTPTLFAGGIPERGFKFEIVEKPEPPPGGTDEFPFALSFGYSLYYWHKNVLVQHSETLKREYGILLMDYPEGFVEINEEDAARLGIRDGAKIRIAAEGGSATTFARVTDETKRGVIFVPYFLHDFVKQIQGKDWLAHYSGSKLIYVKVEKV